MRRVLAFALAWVAFAGVPVLAAKPKQARVSYDLLPPWFRAAIAATSPEGAHDLAWLHRERIVEPLAAGGVRRTTRWVAKALTPAGMEEIAACSAAFSSLSRIERIEAWTVLPDGTAWRPDPKLDRRDDPYLGGYEMADDVRILTLSAPRVTTGAIVACESVEVSTLDAGADEFTFGFGDEPSRHERVELVTPDGWTSEVVTARSDGLAIERSSSRIVVEARDVKAPAREEYRPSPSQLLPQAWLRWGSPDGTRGFPDWDAVVRWNAQLSESVLEEAGAARAVGERLKPAGPEAYLAALEKAFEFAARDVRYVAVELGMGGWKPRTPAFVVEKRYGDCKDKTFLLRTILAAWGWASYPVLVRTRDHGPLEARAPTFAQFNHMIIAVPLPRDVGADLWTARIVPGLGRVVFLDATASRSTAWDLPEADQGTIALVGRGGDAFLFELPVAPPEANRVTRRLDAEIDANGTLRSGRLVEEWRGNAAAAMRGWFGTASVDERRRRWSDALQGRFPGAGVESRWEGLDGAARTVTVETTLAGGRFARRADALLVVQAGRGTDFEVGALPPAPRRHPLAMPSTVLDDVTMRIRVPDGWLPESLPSEVSFENRFLAVHASWAFLEGTLTYTRTAALKVRDVPADRYAEFREAVSTLGGADARGVVFLLQP
jgi:hypothetical protein